MKKYFLFNDNLVEEAMRLSKTSTKKLINLALVLLTYVKRKKQAVSLAYNSNLWYVINRHQLYQLLLI